MTKPDASDRTAAGLMTLLDAGVRLAHWAGDDTTPSAEFRY
jgi:hypothetical protein